MTTGTASFLQGPNLNILLDTVIVAVIIVISAIAFSYGYWVGITVLLLSSLIFIGLRFRNSDRLNSALTVYAFLFVVAMVSSLVQPWLAGGQSGTVRDAIIQIVGTSDAALIFTSIVIGIIVALVIGGILFGSLGLPRFSVTVEDGEVKGSAKAKNRFKSVGGPGRLRVFPRQVAVLCKHGDITRVVGQGVTRIARKEQLRNTIMFDGKTELYEITPVLTRDRIVLKVKARYKVRIEAIKDTQDRLKTMEEQLRREQLAQNELIRNVLAANYLDPNTVDKLEKVRERLIELEAQKMQQANAQPPANVAQFELLSKHKDSLEKVSKLGEDIKKLRKTIEGDDVVGDSGTQCYVDIAKRTHPDPWGSTQGIVASTIRDVFRSHDFEDLFNAQPGTTDLQTGVDSLQLAAIQKFVQNKVKENKFGSGLEVDFINIEEIEFPEMIREKMEEQITSIVESRIMTTKANARIQEADAKRQVMITEAQAIQDAMASRANAMRIEEQMRTEIKADYYRRIIQTLQEEGQSIDTIQEVLKSLASTSAWEDEFRQLIQMMRPYIQIDQNIRELPSSLANGRGWTTRITNSND